MQSRWLQEQIGNIGACHTDQHPAGKGHLVPEVFAGFLGKPVEQQGSCVGGDQRNQSQNLLRFFSPVGQIRSAESAHHGDEDAVDQQIVDHRFAFAQLGHSFVQRLASEDDQ